MSNTELDYLIREYEPEDRDAIYELARESLGSIDSGYYNLQQIEALMAAYSTENKSNFGTIDLMNYIGDFINSVGDLFINDDKPTAIVAQIEDKIVGYGSMRRSDWSENSQLSNLYVHPEYVRRGVGTKLLQTLENSVIENCQVVNLFATLSGEPFYQANGYQSINNSSFLVRGIRIPYIYMEKWFKTPSDLEKFFWDSSQQVMRNVERLTTESEYLFREMFNQ